jgi:hypothetical protein
MCWFRMLDFSQFKKKVSKRYTLGAQGTVSVKKNLDDSYGISVSQMFPLS